MQVMRRNEQQSAMDAFNKRIGRPSAAAPYVRAAAPVPAPVQAAALPPQYTPQAAQAAPRQAQPPPAPAPAAAAAYAPAPYSNVSSKALVSRLTGQPAPSSFQAQALRENYIGQ